MAAILTDVGLFVTALLSIVTETIAVIIANPILLIGLIGGIVMMGVGLFRKLKA